MVWIAIVFFEGMLFHRTAFSVVIYIFSLATFQFEVMTVQADFGGKMSSSVNQTSTIF